MCQSPDISLVRRTVDVKYAIARRSASLRWLLVNATLLAVLLYDLCVWCGAWCGVLAGVEAVVALILLANCVGHLACLARPPPRPLTAGVVSPSTPGDNNRSIISSINNTTRYRVGARKPSQQIRAHFQWTPPRMSTSSVVEEPGSLSPARSWRSSPPSPSPPRGRGSGGGSPRSPRADPDEFIADGRALAAFIRQAEGRAAEVEGEEEEAGAGGGTPRLLPAPLRAHQLALLPERGGTKEQTEEEGAGGGGAAGGGGGGTVLWRRLSVDPDRLTEYNLNLRLWLHLTVVGRVARELAAGETSPPAALHAFLAPFADRQYVADRIKELSRGGCLSAYRWDGGGRGWRAGGERPCDAELLLHLFATYMDAVAPAGGGGGAFTARHLSVPPAPAPRSPTSYPVLRRTSRWPPHYVVLMRGETLEVGGGRNNLLHALLLLVGTAGRSDPPALCRLHLGPAGLNMLWILGR